jgi:hypothetical protein
MTDYLAIARECGGVAVSFVAKPLEESEDGIAMHPAALSAFAERVRQDERERCAAICERRADDHAEAAEAEKNKDYRERYLVYAKHIRRCADAILNQVPERAE